MYDHETRIYISGGVSLITGALAVICGLLLRAGGRTKEDPDALAYQLREGKDDLKQGFKLHTEIAHSLGNRLLLLAAAAFAISLLSLPALLAQVAQWPGPKVTDRFPPIWAIAVGGIIVALLGYTIARQAFVAIGNTLRLSRVSNLRELVDAHHFDTVTWSIRESVQKKVSASYSLVVASLLPFGYFAWLIFDCIAHR